MRNILRNLFGCYLRVIKLGNDDDDDNVNHYY